MPITTNIHVDDGDKDDEKEDGDDDDNETGNI